MTHAPDLTDRRRFSGPFFIVNTITDEPLESHGSRKNAEHYCEVVNNHEKRCGRNPQTFAVVENWRAKA